MVALPTPRFGNTSFSVLMVTLWLTSCVPTGPVDFAGEGGKSGAGTGGQTGSGGTTPASGGAPGSGGNSAGTGGNSAGTGGKSAGTGGASGSGTGGVTTSSGGRQGGGTGGRAGTGGSPSTDGGTPDGGGVGTGGAAGGTSGNLPAGYTVCVPCHGADGVGVAGHGPDIQHPVVDFSTWAIRNGRVHPDFPEAMPKFAVDVITDAQLQGILSYLAARPKPTTGQTLFVDYCANCHGANAAGGVTMRPINTEPMTAFTTMVRGGHSLGQFAMRREFMPKWTTTELTDAELRLIFTYVDGL